MNNSYLENAPAENNPIENNQVEVVGVVLSAPEFSHEVYSESFYSFKLDVPRLSDTSDRLIITISERLLLSPVEVGQHVSVKGQFRSYNNFSEVGSRLVLTVFVKHIEVIENCREHHNPNNVFLNGYVCKPPIYRTTPFGREIADILLAVNRSYNKSDYIPCISWGRNAKFASGIPVGKNIKVWGRIQSRDYQKKVSLDGEDDQFETKTAYEISVSKMEFSDETPQPEHTEATDI